jgi:electron transfer flavoprotein alpha subunit
MAVLVLADTDRGRLTPATARVVAAAAELGPVDLLVDAAAAEEARTLAGVQTVLAAALPVTAEALAPVLAKLAEPYTHIVAAANALGRDVIPRLAALLDIMPVTDITAILGPMRFERPIYAGNATETVSDGQPKHILSVRAPAFSPAVAGNSAALSNISTASGGETRVVSEERNESTRPELSTAQIVVAGGIPLGDRFGLVEELAGKLGAAVGATRALVDAGYAPNDLQIGQTG